MTVEANAAAPEENDAANPAPETEAPAAPDVAADPTPEADPAAVEAPAGDDADQDDDQEQAEPEKKHKRAGGWQRQIERLERQNQLLIEQLTRGGQQPAPPKPDKEKTESDKAAEWLDGLLEQKLAAREAQQRQAQAQAELQRRTAEVRAKYPDFDDVVNSVSHMYVSPAVQKAILKSKQGPDIMYQLASRPDELARISALPDEIEAALEIAGLVAPAASTASPKAKPNVAPRKPAAPPPVNPVKARGPTNVKDPGDMDFEEYKAWRKAGSKS